MFLFVVTIFCTHTVVRSYNIHSLLGRMLPILYVVGDDLHHTDLYENMFKWQRGLGDPFSSSEGSPTAIPNNGNV